ncbi:MAG: hypothetical protein AB7O45_13090 [Alphaproteobacteria bacterium]
MEWLAELVGGAAAVAVAGAAWLHRQTEGKVAEWAIFVATSAGALVGYLALRRRAASDRLGRDPISSAEIYREQEGGIGLRINFLNRGGHALSVRAARVRRPRGARIAQPSHPPGAKGPVFLFEAAATAVGWEIAPDDRLHGWLVIEPPPQWSGGKVAVDLSVVSMASTARSRRITIARRL